MRKVFGRIDWVVNGAIFGLYHLHQPWSMPASILDSALTQAFPTKRYQSIWIGRHHAHSSELRHPRVVLALVL